LIDGFSKINDYLTDTTTSEYIQEFKKAGLYNLLASGVQISSLAILNNKVMSKNMYEITRFWSQFVYFDVPKWEEDSNKTKYIVT
jgi:hypothetical protein